MTMATTISYLFWDAFFYLRAVEEVWAALRLFGWMLKGHTGILLIFLSVSPKWLDHGPMDLGRVGIATQHPVLKPNHMPKWKSSKYSFQLQCRRITHVFSRGTWVVTAMLRKKETDLKAETSSIAPLLGWLKSLVIVFPLLFFISGIFIQLQLEKGDFQSTSWRVLLFVMTRLLWSARFSAELWFRHCWLRWNSTNVAAVKTVP